MTDQKFDVCVIGAGPAGYVAAIRAAQLGLQTAIIDKEWMGGVCLNIGCIPSKALLKNAQVADLLRNGSREFGFSLEGYSLDYQKAVQRSRRVSQRLTRGVELLMKQNDITILMGEAHIPSPGKITVTDQEGSVTHLQTSHTVIATGARPMSIPGMDFDGEKILSYRSAILQETLPASAAIIGSGAIGVEFATIWNAYGVDVTIVEMLPELVPNEDPEISQELRTAFRKKRVNVLTSHRVESITTTASGVEIRVQHDGQSTIIEAEQALVAIGFIPYTKGLGLEELGIERTPRGGILIDERMATNIPGIWAVGDVTDRLMLAHVGSAQGIICAEQIAGKDAHQLEYDFLPRSTYCQPQIASFGLTKKQAQERDLPVQEYRFPLQANGKALGLGDYRGWVKFVVEEETNRLLGAHMIGPEVTELLPELTLLHQLELPVQKIAHNVHAHPTLSEALMETAHLSIGQPIHI